MDQLAQVPITLCLSKVTLAAGTTTTISTTGTTTYAIKGKALTKAAVTNGATPITDASTGLAFPPISKGQGTVVVIGWNAAATAFLASQGSVEPLDAANAFIRAPQMPDVPDTMCPIGYITLLGGSTLAATWTFGTNNLSGVTGMTYNFVDLIGMPDRPQIA